MTPLHANKTCELHVHLGGCFYLDDLLRFGRDVYADVDWSECVDAFERSFGTRPDITELFRNALRGSAGLDALRDHYVYTPEDGPDFDRFSAKFNLLIGLARHYRFALGRDREMFRVAIDHHREEGLDYIEYRSMYMRGASADPEGFVSFHRENAETIRDASDDGFAARYIISLPRWEPLLAYDLVLQLLDASPELIDTVVGLDFCHVEEGHPPASAQPLFARVAADNQRHPERALEIVYHVAESFYDKSLESAVRWCHEAALLGARRLGHCIALGLDPAIAVARRENAHQRELVDERRDQIDYDLAHGDALVARGVAIDEAALAEEKRQLSRLDPAGFVSRPYTLQRLDEIAQRQDLVLAELTCLGTPIETCPTSNLCLGGVPEAAAHPLHRFLASDVDLVISADDPGIFDSPLAAEVGWVAQHVDLDEAALAARLGDPRRFRLGDLRAGTA